MINGKTFLAIIPARGGSKRLPKKNILNLADKPLISWTIEAALNSNYIDQVIVTSDCREILDISKQNGADIIERPIELASDTSSSFEAIQHTIKNAKKYDFIILLQATSPLRTFEHIDSAIELLNNKNADAVISVCEMEHSPLWSNTLPEDNNMNDFIDKDIKNKRSQDLETHYRLNGAIYICKTNKLLKESTFFIDDNIFAFKMNAKDSIDIDKEIDFNLANLILKKSNSDKAYL